MSAAPFRVQLLHHKERGWADYLIEYSDLGSLRAAGRIDIEIESLPQQNAHQAFAELPESIRRLLYFAKPDVLVCLDDGVRSRQPIFALDVTEHVAARDHWIQRFPNLVGCAIEGVPGAFVATGDMPNRPGFRGHTDPFFYFAYDRVVEIHQTPIFIAQWPASNGIDPDTDAKYGEFPPHDAEDIQRSLRFFNLVLASALKGVDLSSLMRDRLVVDLRNELRKIGYAKIPKVTDFARLSINMPGGRPLDEGEMTAWLATRGLQLPEHLPERVRRRGKYVVFSPYTTRPTTPAAIALQRQSLKKRIKANGGDPYGQQPLVFDYLFCRIGPTTEERDSSLVVDLGVLEFGDLADYVSSAWRTSPLGKTTYAQVADKIPHVYAPFVGRYLPGLEEFRSLQRLRGRHNRVLGWAAVLLMATQVQEDEIVREAARCLREHGWSIVAARASQASVYFHLSNGRRKAPDIVAIRGRALLVAECKALASRLGAPGNGRISDLEAMRFLATNREAQVELAEQAFRRARVPRPEPFRCLPIVVSSDSMPDGFKAELGPVRHLVVVPCEVGHAQAAVRSASR